MATFYFHYNKPAAQKAKKPKMSIHYNNQCFVVDHIVCNVPVSTKHRTRQPYCVMAGKALRFTVKNKKGQKTIVIG